MASISPPLPKPQPDKFSDALALIRIAMDPDAMAQRLEELHQAETHAKDALAAAEAAKNERALADERITAAQQAEADMLRQRQALEADKDQHLDRLAEHGSAVSRHVAEVEAHARHVEATDARHVEAEQLIAAQRAEADGITESALRLKDEATADREAAAQELAAAKADREKAARILAAAS